MGQQGRRKQGAAKIWELLRWKIKLLIIFLRLEPTGHSGVTENDLGPAGPLIRTFLDGLRSVGELVDEAAFRVERLDRRISFAEALLDGRS